MGKRVLIVDDAAFMRMMLRNILVKLEYEVVGEACNGQEGYNKYMELKPDIVTLDITMPEVDGLKCLKMIKDTDPQAQVIMCSAMGQQHLVLEAVKTGAKDFIIKPFQPDRVQSALNKCN